MRIAIIIVKLFLISITLALIQLLMIFCCNGHNTISILSHGNAHKFIKITSAVQLYAHRGIYLICRLGIKFQIKNIVVTVSICATVIISAAHQQRTRGIVCALSVKRNTRSVFDSIFFSTLVSIGLLYNPVSCCLVYKPTKACSICIQCRI